MRNSLGLVLRRGTVSAFTALSVLSAVPAPVAASPTGPFAQPVAAPDTAWVADEAENIPFTRRFHAVQHGDLVRAANSSLSCRATVDTPAKAATACADARAGQRGGARAANHDFDMFYVDVDDDPNTYNSSQAELKVPDGADVTYARLYWGGNLLVGEQKPPRDNGRVLIAEPGGRYKEVLADTVVGHRVARGVDAFQASADVTELVRSSGPGMWTVAQVNVAMGRSAAGGWGGWTLVAAYEKASEPLRQLAVWDGFAAFEPGHRDVSVALDGVRIPAGAAGRAGLVAYNGDRGTTGDSLTVSTGKGAATALSDPRNPAGNVLNSTIGEPGTPQAGRRPAYAHTLGYDSDVFPLDRALKSGAGRLELRLSVRQDAAWAGVLFAAADTRP
ncbi:DUF3344 domain-containing protein [Streptomyces sp. NPDC091292]|uniref:DUF3344 domain-containing protein n=1 Tax=Streptomyces sp. NPDC091292 TaxID=3365991 RepID=UPI0037FAE1AB